MNGRFAQNATSARNVPHHPHYPRSSFQFESSIRADRSAFVRIVRRRKISPTRRTETPTIVRAARTAAMPIRYSLVKKP